MIRKFPFSINDCEFLENTLYHIILYCDHGSITLLALDNVWNKSFVGQIFMEQILLVKMFCGTKIHRNRCFVEHRVKFG